MLLVHVIPDWDQDEGQDRGWMCFKQWGSRGHQTRGLFLANTLQVCSWDQSEACVQWWGWNRQWKKGGGEMGKELYTVYGKGTLAHLLKLWYNLVLWLVWSNWKSVSTGANFVGRLGTRTYRTLVGGMTGLTIMACFNGDSLGRYT